MNKTGAFIKELLIQINPLFNKIFKVFYNINNLFKVFYNINNLLRVILYKRPYGGFFFYPFLLFFSVNM